MTAAIGTPTAPHRDITSARRRRRPGARAGSGLAILVVALVAACAGGTPASVAASIAPPSAPASTLNPSPAESPQSTPSATTNSAVASDDDALQLVVIGDSIPFGRQFCPGCKTFVDRYAEDLTSRLGRTVRVVNRSRDDSAGMQQIETQITTEATLREQTAHADIVIVSVGFNNALPDASTGVGCQGDMGSTVESYIAWALATTADCLRAGIETYSAQYDRIFSAITALRGRAPTVYIAINVHDGNLGGPDFKNAAVSESVKASVNRWMIDAYDRWNGMLCATAKQHGFACVDLYHAFNGPKGNRPSGANTVDGAHPSQAGNDVIARLLGAVDTSPIGG